MNSLFDIEKSEYQTLTKRDFVIGTIMSISLLTIWAFGSSGMSLIATFIPGIIFAWILFTILYLKKSGLPNRNSFIPLYFLSLGWQFIHFTEEYVTNFKELFPQLYGGQAYSDNTFVAFNMTSYFVFIISPILVYYRGLRFFFVPMLFFTVYGVMGNAIAHSWWSIFLGRYFPGLYTSTVYWLLGIILIYTLLKSKMLTIIFVAIFLLTLVLTLTLLSK